MNKIGQICISEQFCYAVSELERLGETCKSAILERH